MELRNRTIIDLNPEGERLTIEKFRELTGHHSLSDEDAAKAVDSIRKMAKILFLFCSEKRGKEIFQKNDNEEIKYKVA